MAEQKQAIPIGTRVYLSDGRAGYIRVRPISWDYYTVHLDDGEQALAHIDLMRVETFAEFMFKRPGKVGAWGAVEFIGVQAGLLIGMIMSAGTISYGGWVGLLACLGVEGVIYYGMRRNYKHKQA